MGIIPGGSCGNERATTSLCDFHLKEDSKFKNVEILLFDAQTSGGLVFALPQNAAKTLCQTLQDNGIEWASIIGEVVPNTQEKRIHIY